MQEKGVSVWLSGVQPDLLKAFERLNFFEWYRRDRLFRSKYDDNSSTIDAIKGIRRELPRQAALSEELVYQA